MQVLIDMVNGIDAQPALNPAALTQATIGPVLDMSPAHEPLNAVVHLGAFGAGQGALNLQIEECATTNGTFTPIPGMVGVYNAGNGLAVLRGQRNKQYVRVNATTVGGTTPSAVAGVTLFGQLKLSPESSGVDRYPSN